MNPVLDCMSSHRTVRKFLERELEDDVVAGAVRAAQMAATSSNVQAYSCLRVRAPAKRSALVELCGSQPQVAKCGATFVIAGDQRRHRLIARRAGVPYEPNLETFLLAVIDASLFAQNLTLAFESLGFGTCYIGGLRRNLPQVTALLELPSDVFPFFGLAVGEPAQDPERRPRLPLEAVLLEDAYPDDATLLASVDRYDAVMGSYYAERGKPGHDWSGGIARVFATRSREDLLDYYRSQGAVLE